MIYTLDGELHLSDVPTPLLHQLIRELTVPNPRYENALRLGRPAWSIPRTIMLYEIKGNALTLPRGSVRALPLISYSMMVLGMLQAGRPSRRAFS